jgi:DNA repair exonuclease SbcCD ATPase subunit
MKQILLRNLVLRNFKGIRDLTIDFTDQETVICGDNGTGKTTIFDAFLWLLFGKDSTNRADGNGGFNIKTLDTDGKPILNLEHVVTATLLVNGNEVTLQRSYLEKWGTGTNAGQLKNHYTEFFLNGVKLDTKKAFDAEVSNILPEDVFRMVTNPFYFPSLPAATQKTMLLDMAGNVSDQDVAALKPEYLELLSQLTGKSLEQFKKETASKKRAIQDELKELPARIDTANQMKPEAEDWAVLERELAGKIDSLKKIDEQISDKSKQVEATYEAKSSIQKKVGEKRLERSKREGEIRENANKANGEARTAIRDLEYKIQTIQGDIDRKKKDVSTIDAQINTINNELDTLRGEYRVINDEQLEYPDGAFTCPTCKRPLEADDIEAKQQEMLANFNHNKSTRLQQNQTTGKTKAGKKTELQKKREDVMAEISKLEKELVNLQAQKSFQEGNLPAAQDAQKLIEADAIWVRLGNEISELDNQLNVDVKPVDVSELQEGKRVLSDCIADLNKRLAKRETIERAEKLIQEYEDKKLSNNDALAKLEKTEFIITDFQKAKDNELMKRINGMFSLVSFSFVDEQLNGNEKITCVCTVDGVPFPDLNNATKINAGLDIINAICKSKGISAPIFIDNRESVNKLIPTVSQVINLSVSNHPKLMIRTFTDGMMETFHEL